jgi:hypothetical protein
MRSPEIAWNRQTVIGRKIKVDNLLATCIPILMVLYALETKDFGAIHFL